MKGIKKYVKPLPIRYIILVFFLIIIICILFFKSKQGFLVTSGGIVTIAGTGVTGNSGDNVLATSAQLSIPMGIALDSTGNIYFIDNSNHRIRKLTPNAGTNPLTYNISTVAGTGVPTTPANNTASTPGIIGIAPNGDGGPAKNATLNYPHEIALDSDGNIYFTDTSNHRIRKLTPNAGTNPLTYNISTVAGTGVQSFSGDNVPALSATFNFPRGIAFDSLGNIYIVDANNQRIRKLTPNADKTTYNISTIAGTGVATTHVHSIAKPPQNGDGGPAKNATLYSPYGIALDSAGNIYIAETSGHRIRKLTPNAGTNPLTYNISTIAGTGVATTSAQNTAVPPQNGDEGPLISATFSSPRGIEIDSAGNIYIADTNSQRIRKVDKNGIITTIAGNGLALLGTASDNYMLPTDVQVRGPSKIAVDLDGNIYITDTNTHRIRKIYK